MDCAELKYKLNAKLYKKGRNCAKKETVEKVCQEVCHIRVTFDEHLHRRTQRWARSKVNDPVSGQTWWACCMITKQKRDTQDHLVDDTGTSSHTVSLDLTQGNISTRRLQGPQLLCSEVSAHFFFYHSHIFKQKGGLRKRTRKRKKKVVPPQQ